ncbi:MAG TPA: hypothetical protein DEA08_09845 [Planctomycetes bacterium]|nr:hypothetical protein [Planctomycetota bacterium]
MRRSSTIALLLALLLIPAALLAQDVIYKTDGGRLRGKIVADTPRYVKIKTLGGVYTVPRADIARIEREGDVQQTFERRRDKLRGTDAKGWYALGVWAQDQGLHPQAVDCFHKTIQIDRDHEDARWELGYRRLNGRWVTEADYFSQKGYVRWEDKWVSQEEYEKYESGLVKVEGRWITQEAAAALEKEQEGKGGGARAEEPRRQAGKPAKGARQAGRARGFPWVGRNRPLGGQVGQPKLSKAERDAQLERNKQAGRWKVAYASKYYDFYSNGDEAEVAKFARTLDLMCEEFKRIFVFKQEITRPFPIHLYASQREFMSRTGKGAGVGGFYDGRKIVGYHGKQTGESGTLSTLFHEGTHQFQGLVLGRNMWRAKIWLIEGLAVFFEASKAQGKRLKTGAIPKGRLAHVKRAIQSGSYVKLHDLIRMEQRQFGALHYAHAWSLIYFLINGTKGGKKRFKEYWEQTKVGGQDPVKLFEELFNKPMEEIEAAWKAYVLRLS